MMSPARVALWTVALLAGFALGAVLAYADSVIDKGFNITSTDVLGAEKSSAYRWEPVYVNVSRMSTPAPILAWTFLSFIRSDVTMEEVYVWSNISHPRDVEGVSVCVNISDPPVLPNITGSSHLGNCTQSVTRDDNYYFDWSRLAYSSVSDLAKSFTLGTGLRFKFMVRTPRNVASKFNVSVDTGSVRAELDPTINATFKQATYFSWNASANASAPNASFVNFTTRINVNWTRWVSDAQADVNCTRLRAAVNNTVILPHRVDFETCNKVGVNTTIYVRTDATVQNNTISINTANNSDDWSNASNANGADNGLFHRNVTLAFVPDVNISGFQNNVVRFTSWDRYGASLNITNNSATTGAVRGWDPRLGSYIDGTGSASWRVCAQDQPRFTPGTGGNLTIEGFVTYNDTADSGTHRLLEAMDSGASSGYQCGVQPVVGSDDFIAWGGDGVSVQSGVNTWSWQGDGARHHFGCVFNGSVWAFYSDGQFIGSGGSSANAPTNPNGDIRIGNYGEAVDCAAAVPATGQAWLGRIYDVRLWDIPQTADYFMHQYEMLLTSITNVSSDVNVSTNTAPNISAINVSVINLSAGRTEFNITWTVSDTDGNNTISACWVDSSRGRDRANFSNNSMRCSLVMNLSTNSSALTFTPVVNDTGGPSTVLGTNFTAPTASLNRYFLNGSRTHNVTLQRALQLWTINSSFGFVFNASWSQNSTTTNRQITIPVNGFYGDNLTAKDIDILVENASFNLNGVSDFQLLINDSTDTPVYNVSRSFVLNNTIGLRVGNFTVTLELPSRINLTNVRTSNSTLTYTDTSFTSNANNVTWMTVAVDPSQNTTYLVMSNVRVASVDNLTLSTQSIGANTRYTLGPVITTDYNLSGQRLSFCRNVSQSLTRFDARVDENMTLLRYPSTTLNVNYTINSSRDKWCANWTGSESVYGPTFRWDSPTVSGGAAGGGGGGGGGGTELLQTFIGNLSTDFRAVDAFHVMLTPKGTAWSQTLRATRIAVSCGIGEPFTCAVGKDGEVVVNAKFDDTRLFWREDAELVIKDKDGNVARVPVRVRVLNAMYWVPFRQASFAPANDILFKQDGADNVGVRLWWVASIAGVGFFLWRRQER